MLLLIAKLQFVRWADLGLLCIHCSGHEFWWHRPRT